MVFVYFVVIKMLDTLLQHFINFVCLSGICLIAIGLGRLILCRTGMEFFSRGEYTVFSAGIGFGVMSYSVFILGALQLLYPVAIYILTGLHAVLSIAGWLIMRSSPVQISANKQDAEHPTCIPTQSVGTRLMGLWPGNKAALLDRCFDAILFASLLAGFLLVLTPSVGNDALAYHLAVPKLYLKHHGFFFISGNIFSHYPLNSEMLYLTGIALQGDVLAKGIHFLMGAFVLAGMWEFTRQYVFETRFAIPLTLLVFYTIPSVFVNSHMAYNDLTMTLYTFLAVYAFVNWFNRKQTSWIVLCGVLSGLAVATKYSGLFLPFLGCLGILWTCQRNNSTINNALGLLAIFVLCAVITGIPFYAKNMILTGNPLYPFFSTIFESKGWDIDQAISYGVFLQGLGMGRSFLDYLLLPWNLSFHAKMHSPLFDGVLGPVFILTLPFALGMRKIAIEAKITMVYCLLTFMFWASSAQQIRYLIPVFPFLAIMTGYVLTWYRKHKPCFIVLSAFILFSLIFNGYHIIKDFQKIRPIGVLAGFEDRDGFLNRMIPSYSMFQYINTSLPEHTKIFFIYMKNLGYICERPYYSDSMFESHTMEKILSQSEAPKDVYHAMNKAGFTHILYDINYIMGDISTFSTQERKLFIAFQRAHLELIRVEKKRYYLCRLAL